MRRTERKVIKITSKAWSIQQPAEYRSIFIVATCFLDAANPSKVSINTVEDVLLERFRRMDILLEFVDLPHHVFDFLAIVLLGGLPG